MGLLFVVFPAVVAAESRGAETGLDRYVARADPAYRWELAQTVPGPGFTTYVIDMVSQNWRTTDEVDRTEWRHWLVVVKPDEVRFRTGMLFIGGGRNGRPAPERPDDKVVALAARTGSVVAELRMVPNQPLVFGGDGVARFEDDLIAYAWDKYLTTGDETWVPRLPMVKSAVRAMDTIQAFLGGSDGGGVKIDQFVVAGGSKRGWTTWLTGAVDRRVTAIVPIVIDVLNVRPSMHHHFAAYGFWAPAIGDYVHHKIPERFDTPEFDALMRVADPYAYRDRLTMPKYVVNASGDQFFLPDSWQFYFGDLLGEKHLRYVPNADHSLGDSNALEGILAFYRAILTGAPRPEFEWSAEPGGAIRVKTRDKPKAALLWQATSPDARDFRVESIGRAYRQSLLTERRPGEYIARVDRPERGWTAFFVELVFEGPGPEPFRFSTGVQVVPDVLPFVDRAPQSAGISQ
jgi:PhoPQ-activated pathogenicity-related protein